MIRMMINWTFISPILQTMKGIVKAEFISYGNVDRLLFKCKVSKTKGSLGYSSFDKDDDSLSIPHDLFEELRPTIDSMVRSYFHGMMLEDYGYEWINDSIDVSLEEWAKKRNLTLPEGI